MPLTPLQALNRVMEDRVASVRMVGFRTLANLLAAGAYKTKKDTQINWNVSVGGATVAWEPMTANGTSNAVGDTVPANLLVGQHRLKHQFPISKVAIEEASTRAPEDLADLLGRHVDEGVSALMQKLNTELYAADGTAASGGMVGLNKVYDNTAPYANIDPAVYTKWKALTLTNGTPRAFSRDLMLDYDEMLAIEEGLYNFVVCHPTTAKSYIKVFDALGGASSIVNLADPEMEYLKRVDLGHAGRFFNGIPLVEDPACPVGAIRTMYTPSVLLNFFELTPSVGTESATAGLTLGQHVVNTSYGIPIHVAELPSSNSAVRIFELFVLPQLQVFNRRHVGGILNLL